MKSSASPKTLLLLLLLAVAEIGCSTVKAPGSARFGLLDRLERLERPTHSSARAERRPAAVLVSEMKEKGVELRWPLETVQVTSMFGNRGKDVHEGIDLRAKSGTAVYAAESGVVLFAGQRLKGYGKLIVLRHQKGIATVYAHNSKLLVRVGQRVRKGAKIALSGNSGRSSGPHLHFEVRSGVDPIDPWLALPDPKAAQRAARRGLAQSN